MFMNYYVWNRLLIKVELKLYKIAVLLWFKELFRRHYSKNTTVINIYIIKFYLWINQWIYIFINKFIYEINVNKKYIIK